MTDQTEAPQERDPIFAAIERHKAGLRAHEAKTAELAATGLLAGPELDQLAAAMTEQSKAVEALLATTPTTKAGAYAALEYLIVLGWDENLEVFAETLRNSQIFSNGLEG
jgi:hypothetical protein